jgi:hypothetical protein
MIHRIHILGASGFCLWSRESVRTPYASKTSLVSEDTCA